ncbi:hypothetical protein Tco_0695917 [Tanacetum coccineum]
MYRKVVYGLGVHSLDIQSMANSFGCLENNLPFAYLGVKVAANMARSLLTYYMSLFKAPDGVLSHLERLRNSLFLGAEMDECKITWVFVLASLKLLTVLIALLFSHPTCIGCSIWIMVHKADASLKSKDVDLLGLFNLDLQKDASVAQKFQNPEFVVSFQRCPRSAIEESQL